MTVVLVDERVISEEETKTVIDIIFEYIIPGTCVTLNGELGAGKTFITKYITSKFGIKQISSPTFSLVNVYAGSCKFYHLDFYRIQLSEELFDIGYFEMIGDAESIIVIEWANMFPEVLPLNRIDISIEIGEDTERFIKVLKYE